MPNNDHHDVPPPSPYVVIPYFANDKGRPGIERPLTSAHPSWLCPSIDVVGGPYFTPGAPLSVRVRVANHGGGPQIDTVNVIVYWADPTTGFTASKTYLGQGAVDVARGGGSGQTPVITGMIPGTASSHICLLALAYTTGDVPKTGSPVDPVNDRHWAQLNLNVLAADWNGGFGFTFFAANPFAKGAAFDVVARMVNRQSLEAVSRYVRADAQVTEDVRLTLRPMNIRGTYARDAASERESRVRVELDGGARQAIQIRGQLPGVPEPGRFVAVEVVQMHGGPEREERVIGSIGLVIVAPQRK